MAGSEHEPLLQDGDNQTHRTGRLQGVNEMGHAGMPARGHNVKATLEFSSLTVLVSEASVISPLAHALLCPASSWI